MGLKIGRFPKLSGLVHQNMGFFPTETGDEPEKILGGEFTKGFKGIRMIRHEKKMTEHAAILGTSCRLDPIPVTRFGGVTGGNIVLKPNITKTI